MFAVNEALYRKEITVQKQKLIILEIRQTKSLTDGLPDNKTDGSPDNKTVDKTLAAIEFRSVIWFDEGVQFPLQLSDKHAHWCV